MNKRIAILGYGINRNYGAQITLLMIYDYLSEVNDVDIIRMGSKSPNKTEKDFCGKFVLDHANVVTCIDDEDFLALNDVYDVFIVPSDQIWRYNGKLPRFLRGFLDFVNEDKLIISYATSFGIDYFKAPQYVMEGISKLLARFDAISVREESSEKLLVRDFGVHGKWVADPIFFGKKSLDSYLRHYEEFNHQYQFSYILDPDENTSKYMLINRDLLNLNNLFITGEGQSFDTPDMLSGDLGADYNPVNHIPVVSVEKMLSGITGSKYVFTDSFHGVCLALMYHRPFTVLVNEFRGSERLKSLLGYLGLMDRMVNLDGKCDSLDCTEELRRIILNPIEWDRVDKKLNDFVLESQDWLNKALGISKKKVRATNGMGITKGILELGEKRAIERTEIVGRYLKNQIDTKAVIAIRGGGVTAEHLINDNEDIFRSLNKPLYIIDKKPIKLNTTVDYIWIKPEEVKTKDIDVILIGIVKKDMKEEVLKENYGLGIKVMDIHDLFEGELLPGRAYYTIG